MTRTTNQPELIASDVEPYIPPGRPVRRFVVAIAGLAVVFAAVAVVGPFTPRVETWIPAWNIEDDQVTAAVALTNTGRFTVEVRDFAAAELREPVPFREYVVTGVGDEFRAGPVLPAISIDPGETVNVALVFTCADRRDPFQADIRFDRPEIDVEVALGVRRGAVADVGFSFGTECPTG